MNSYNEPLLFNSAIGFYEQGLEIAKKIDFSINNKAFELVPTATVCYSFSAELLLKLLILQTTKKTAKGHNLRNLFSELPTEVKLEINNSYESKKQKSNLNLKPIKLTFNTDISNIKDREDVNEITKLSLDELLNIHSESFVKWRYLYEVKNEYYYYEFNFKLMDDFINSIIKIIKYKLKK